MFSVLIAHFNNARFLDAAMQSVLRQTYSDWEVVLVDDGSTDEFEQVISAYAGDERIRVFRNDGNQGCGYAKRRCASLARGTVAGFLDPDDALAPTAIEVMMRAHEQNPELSLIYSTHFICDEELHPVRLADYVRPLPDGVPFLLLGDGSVHLFATFKTANYAATEGIAAGNKRAVDKDLYYKLEETGRMLYIPEPLYYYRIHNGGISNAGNEQAASLANYQIAREACLRRIAQGKRSTAPQSIRLLKTYRARYYKLTIMQAVQEKQWGKVFSAIAMYSVVGGLPNLVSYLGKLAVNGRSVFRRSFVEPYKIRVR